MSPDLDQGQTHDILVLERTASIFSIVGCLFIFGTFVSSHRFRRPINRLIFYASWGNLLLTIATLMSVAPKQLQNPKEAPLCRFQGFMIQMFLPADALWNLSIAINVYLIIFRNWTAVQLRRLEIIYILFNYGITFAIAFTYLFIDDGDPDGRGRVYGPATLWCWVDREWEGFRIWLCYAPAWACILAIFIIYTLAWIDIFNKRKAVEAERTRRPPRAQPVSGGDMKLQQVHITTEIRRTSHHTPLNSAHLASTADVNSKHLFNPFSLDPTNLRGYDPYSITIECGDDPEEARKRAVAAEANAAIDASHSYTRTALLYFVSLLITWVPSSMNRVYSLAYPGSVQFTFSVMAGLVLPLMGFWNSVIYLVTSWDAVVAICKDMLLKERVLALKPQSGRRKGQEDPAWVEIVSVKDVPQSSGSACHRSYSDEGTISVPGKGSQPAGRHCDGSVQQLELFNEDGGSERLPSGTHG